MVGTQDGTWCMISGMVQEAWLACCLRGSMWRDQKGLWREVLGFETGARINCVDREYRKINDYEALAVDTDESTGEVQRQERNCSRVGSREKME